jgi:hypothetical protein
LHIENQALLWLLKDVKESERLGRWILRLAPFNFKVANISGPVQRASSRTADFRTGPSVPTRGVSTYSGTPEEGPLLMSLV